MSKTYQLNVHDETFKVTLYTMHYWDENLVVEMDYFDEDFKCYAPFCTLSVNLDESIPPDQFFVDTNNCPWAEQFLQENNIAKPVGRCGHSGFCTYPLYELLEGAI